MQIVHQKCYILDRAIERYKSIIKRVLKHREPNAKENSNFAEVLNEVTIDLKNACEEKPHHSMVEECKQSNKINTFKIHFICVYACIILIKYQFVDTLKVENTKAHIESTSIWGILRALETFSQLIVSDGTEVRLKINTQEEEKTILNFFQ